MVKDDKKLHAVFSGDAYWKNIAGMLYVTGWASKTHDVTI